MHIKIEALPPESAYGPYIIQGHFRVAYEQNGLCVEGPEVLKHIAMVVTEGGCYQSFNPFANTVVFPDDIQKTEKGCSGQFHCEPFALCDLAHAADYYITCSIGTLVSNTVKISRLVK